MPLADELRPSEFEDIVGQQHLFGKNGVISATISKNYIPSMIFYGPPGTGKTTAANIIAKKTNKQFYKLNATVDSLKDIKDIIKDINTIMGYSGVVVYIDEIHHFTKRTQQVLLEFVEKGQITLIASTTENPYFYIFKALLSRAFIFEFKPINSQDIVLGLNRVIYRLESELINKKIVCEDDILISIAESSSGDMRKAINILELLINSSTNKDEQIIKISIDDLKKIPYIKVVNYDRDGDSHYDILSAFQKSIRGSDPDAALIYLALLIKGGDLVSICRRLLVISCEDIGLAYPNGISIVKACTDAAMQVGFPEAKIPLAQAVILLSTAPKSNSVVMSIDKALYDIEHINIGDIPKYLKDAHYSGAKELGRQGYKYPHDYQNHYIEQEYLPENIRNNVYYKKCDNKYENSIETYWKNIKK
jgi:putative ATPase